jgi:hypothetical protein
MIVNAQIAREREERLQRANRRSIIRPPFFASALTFLCTAGFGRTICPGREENRKILAHSRSVARIALRACATRDVQRLINDGVLAGPLPAGDSWPVRAGQWLDEMQAGRRLVMVAEFGGVLVGMGQLIFRFANGYLDAEAANGSDIAMIDSIRMRPEAPANLSTHIVAQLEKYAKKHRIRTVTFLVPMDNNRVLNQVKSWGFEEFRIMPEGAKLLAFFRKRIA